MDIHTYQVHRDNKVFNNQGYLKVIRVIRVIIRMNIKIFMREMPVALARKVTRGMLVTNGGVN